MTQNNPTKRLVLAAFFLALALLLPIIIGQIPEIGSMLSPMHIPVYLCGFICGPFWGLAVGLVAPLLKTAIWGVPAIVTSMAMAVELATYGAVAGVLYKLMPHNTISLYLSLLGAMVAGRIGFGVAMYIILGIQGGGYTMAAFLTSALFGAVPGIIAHFILVPGVMVALRRTGMRV